MQDMPLKERTYNCESCGHLMDRDLNAAINLSRLA
ncbi:MAG: transposase [Oscillatoriaceae cyanobacterium Prado104]|nr:transposase [Oscillatoriaceae cyanobacterium Prado104]